MGRCGCYAPVRPSNGFRGAVVCSRVSTQAVVTRLWQPEDTYGQLRRPSDDMKKNKTVRRAQASQLGVIRRTGVVPGARGPPYVGGIEGHRALHGGNTRRTHNRCWGDVEWFPSYHRMARKVIWPLGLVSIQKQFLCEAGVLLMCI